MFTNTTTMRTLTLTVTLISFVLNSSAQIILLGTAGSELKSLINLTAGTKLMNEPSGASFTIYNIDLSTYRVVTLPPVPPGYSFSNVSFITEALFDTDPATIEYMAFYSGGSPGDNATLIAREDGTVLFSAVPGISLQPGYDGINASPGIFETATGAVMLIQSTFGGPTSVYSLPGHAPCASICSAAADPSGLTSGTSELTPSGGGTLFPNPADGMVTITYSLPWQSGIARLRIHDVSGRVIIEDVADGSGTYRLDTSRLTPGHYTITMVGTSGTFMNSKLLVSR